MEGAPKAPTREQVENTLERLRAEREAYIRRLTEMHAMPGEQDALEGDAADAQLADFDEKIATLEKGLALLDSKKDA